MSAPLERLCECGARVQPRVSQDRDAGSWETVSPGRRSHLTPSCGGPCVHVPEAVCTALPGARHGTRPHHPAATRASPRPPGPLSVLGSGGQVPASEKALQSNLSDSTKTSKMTSYKTCWGQVKEARPYKSTPVHSVTLNEACLLPGTSRHEPQGTTQEATS